VLQCAYGSFLRTVPLPAAVKDAESRATYRNGVLKVELTKLQPGKPSVTQITVH
jgi:HSP20 family protein